VQAEDRGKKSRSRSNCVGETMKRVGERNRGGQGGELPSQPRFYTGGTTNGQLNEVGRGHNFWRGGERMKEGTKEYEHRDSIRRVGKGIGAKTVQNENKIAK